MKDKATLTRRTFLEATAAGAAGMMLTSPNRFALGGTGSPNGRLNVGVIGPGAQGSTLIRNLALLRDTRITVVCDIFEPNRARGAALAGSSPKTTVDYRKVLDDKEVDAVVIALPLFLHSE